MALLALPACASLLGLNEDYADRAEQTSNAGAPGEGGAPMGVGGATGGTSASQAGQLGTGVGGSKGGSGAGGVVSPLARVVHGQTSLAEGTAERSLEISGVAAERSLLVFGTSFDSTSSSRTEISGQLTSGDTLAFKRAAGNGAPNVPIEYYVAEFGSGVLVQRGSVTLDGATTRVALKSPASLERSFPIVTFRNTGSVYGLDDHVRAKLTSPTELSLEMYQASGDGVVEWQVVTFDGARVQFGDVTVGGDAVQVTSPLASAVDPSVTWLALSYQVANIGTGAADLMLRGHLEPSQVVLDRAASGASATVTYYAISFDNGTSVQSGELAVAAQSQAAEASLDGVDALRCVAVASGNYLRGGSTGYASANNPGYSSFRFGLTSERLTATRGASAATGAATVAWNVIQFR